MPIIKEQKGAPQDARSDLEFMVEYARTVRGQASPLLGLEPVSRRSSMSYNANQVATWTSDRISMTTESEKAQWAEVACINELGFSALQFYNAYGNTMTDWTFFEPTLDRFALLCRVCDWPVIAYPDGLEVFFCAPSSERHTITPRQIFFFELSRAMRILMVGTLENTNVADLNILGHSLLDLVSVSHEQLR